MKYKFLYLFALLITIVGCRNPYPDSNFIISQKARNYLSFYKSNGLWIFKNDLITDTLSITTMDSGIHNPRVWFFDDNSNAPFKTIGIGFRPKHYDKWQSVTYTEKGEKTMPVDQGIRIIKSPLGNESISLSFKHYNYDNSLDSIDHIKGDTLIINNILFTEYDIFKLSTFSDEIANYMGSDTMYVYWVNKYGIIAYRYGSGKLWKRINLK
jgi:hypothetical protein